MINKLIPYVLKLKEKYPNLYYKIVGLGKKLFKNRLGVYPKIMGNEFKAVKEVLESSQWNMCYGKGLSHEKLEDDFCKFVDMPYAIAVGSGGVGLQMSMRVLGMKPGDEVIHQVDTCSATAFSVMNAGVTPIFSDISLDTLMLDVNDIQNNISEKSKAIIATHMWGNPENMKAIKACAEFNNLKIIEDGCLSLGAVIDNKQVGSFGDLAVFSFGCVKPIQGGEGGMIVTKDEAIARELRSLRHWGDRTTEYGVRDVTQLAWNGRMSEIVSAVVREQLKGYPAHLNFIRNSVFKLDKFLQNFQGIAISLGDNIDINKSAFTQIVFKIDPKILSKASLVNSLKSNGIQVWHANFELINSLSFFKNSSWKDWLINSDFERIEKNYTREYINAENVFNNIGIGIGKMSFLSNSNYNYFTKCFITAYKESLICIK
jgi:perosamine synthetase